MARNSHDPTNFTPGSNVLMPQKVVIRTAAFFAATLFIAQLALISYYAMSGTAAAPRSSRLWSRS